jgi:hypothetical protein
MTPAQQAALETLAGRALTVAEIAAANARDDATLSLSLSAGRTQTVPNLIGVGQVMEALGPVAGAAVLDALDAVRTSNRPLYWAWGLLEKGMLDVGSPATQASIHGLAAAGLMTAAQADTLIGLARRPDPVLVGVVSDLLNSEAT